MPVDEIVVLACSKKWGGRCVAGISQGSGRWLRPVSKQSRDGLPPYYWRIDGREIRPLDVVRFEYRGPMGDPTQPENVEVADSLWELMDRIEAESALDVLSSHLARGPQLLGNRGSAVPETVAMRGVDASLALIAPESVECRLDPPHEGTTRYRPRLQFELNGEHYDLALTDYLVRPRLFSAGLGSYRLADLGLEPVSSILLTVSLAEALDGWCTKLVAAVLPLPQGGGELG
jgi:hypothetical protein